MKNNKGKELWLKLQLSHGDLREQLIAQDIDFDESEIESIHTFNNFTNRLYWVSGYMGRIEYFNIKKRINKAIEKHLGIINRCPITV